MQFYFLQRLVDLFLALALWDRFGQCGSAYDVLGELRTMGQFEQIGVAAASIILVNSAIFGARKVFGWIQSSKKPPPKDDRWED